jgi:hypothetical protein
METTWFGVTHDGASKGERSMTRRRKAEDGGSWRDKLRIGEGFVSRQGWKDLPDMEGIAAVEH